MDAESRPSERLTYIDLTKAAGIFLVVLFHTQGIQQALLQYWGASFHVFIFFFTYGLAASGATKRRLAEAIRHSFTALLLPYILWSAIYADLWHGSLKSWLLLIWGSNLAITAGGSNAVLWFLPPMFVASVLYNMLTYSECKLKTHSTIALELTLCVTSFVAGGLLTLYNPFTYGYPFSFDIALFGFGVLLAGRILRKPITSLISQKLGYLGLISLMCLAGCLLCASFNGVRPVVAYGSYGNTLLFVCACLTGCIGITCSMAFAKRICRKQVIAPPAYIGAHSLFYFASHYITFSVLRQLVTVLSIQLPQGLVGACLFTICTLAVSTPACMFISKFVPILEGKQA